MRKQIGTCRAVLAVVLAYAVSTAFGQGAAGGPSDAAQANNPLANIKALNFHNYYISDFTGVDETGNQLMARYAQPVQLLGGDWLLRATLPVNTFPKSGGGKKTGLGDLNAFAAYLMDLGDPAISFGVGPMLNVPTATSSVLGSGKWSIGFANVMFNARSPQYQYGYLLTWQTSFAGKSDRADVNLGAFQPFFMYQLGKGAYLRSTGIWVYDFEASDYTIPIGFGIGQVIPKGNTVYNVFFEPQYSLLDSGPRWPQWQFFFGLNMQFK